MESKQISVTKPSMPLYEEYLEEINNLWESRWLTHTGPKHQKLSKELSEYLEVDNISLFVNGHLALELGIEALDLSGEVITTPFTFASTTQAIVRNRLTPVFCDINEDDYNIDVNKIEELITEKTSAIIPVHVYGNVCDVYKIEEIANKYNLKVIYDAAHVFGVKLNDIAVGNFGDISMFSFHATKVFHTIEGGGLTYSNSKYASKFRELRQFGMNEQENVSIIGTNAKMNEFQAAMGLCNLRNIDEEILKRKRIAERYLERLNGTKGIKTNKTQSGVKSNYAYFPVMFDGYKLNRDEVLKKLKSHNIFARRYFYPLTSEFECYKGKFDIKETPVAKYIADRILCLPLYADLDLKDADRICEIILKD